MGAGVSKEVIARHIRKAKKRPIAYVKKNGFRREPRQIRASNGESAIVYDIVDNSGTRTVLTSEE
jgi:hypothetical protein